MLDTQWDIRHEGRAWASYEMQARADLRPEKLEIWHGKLLLTEEERVLLLGLLLENVGADRVVRMGSSAVWADAVKRAHPTSLSLFSDPMNRWLFAMWLVYIVIIAIIIVVPKGALTVSPGAGHLLVSAGVAAMVSVVVNAFLQL